MLNIIYYKNFSASWILFLFFQVKKSTLWRFLGCVLCNGIGLFCRAGYLVTILLYETDFAAVCGFAFPVLFPFIFPNLPCRRLLLFTPAQARRLGQPPGNHRRRFRRFQYHQRTFRHYAPAFGIRPGDDSIICSGPLGIRRTGRSRIAFRRGGAVIT